MTARSVDVARVEGDVADVVLAHEPHENELRPEAVLDARTYLRWSVKQ